MYQTEDAIGSGTMEQQIHYKAKEVNSVALWDASIYACVKHVLRSQRLPNNCPTINL